jgi:hypothetical protein
MNVLAIALFGILTVFVLLHTFYVRARHVQASPLIARQNTCSLIFHFKSRFRQLSAP